MASGPWLELGTFAPRGGPERPVRAFVPTDVASEGPVPTLWLFDGQNVFGHEGSFAGGWFAHETVDALSPRRHQQPVVIAVGNGGAHRIRELGTHSEDFLDELVETLVPRVIGAVGDGPRVVGGSSLGGLAALQAWCRHPDVFGSAMAMSPSLWFQRRRLSTALERGELTLPPAGRLYLDAGAQERGRMFTDAEALAALVGPALGEDRFLWRPDARGTHHERHWRRRLPKAARFLFRR